MTLPIVRTVDALRQQVRAWNQEGLTTAVVPTMGALHAGHLSLVAAGLAQADRVVATLFVNPAQFNDPDDLDAYPRTEADDAEKLTAAGGHLLYAPSVAEIYPPGFKTKVSVSGLGEPLCGAHRPGHFDGVATVVTKLLLQAGTDYALFGEKDFQQLQIIRRLVQDLNIETQIVGCPTIRDQDGLALSSRNQHLTPDQRRIAPALARRMGEAAVAIARGAAVPETLEVARLRLLEDGFERIEYLELRAPEDLRLLHTLAQSTRLFAAAFLGDVRLIDNISVGTDRQLQGQS